MNRLAKMILRLVGLVLVLLVFCVYMWHSELLADLTDGKPGRAVVYWVGVALVFAKFVSIEVKRHLQDVDTWDEVK